MDVFAASEYAYKNGLKAGKEAAVAEIFDEIEDILDRCAHDNGEMIVKALKELKEKYKGE